MRPIDDVIDGPLVRTAQKAARRTYSPYSHFPVGAAVKTNNGLLYGGCNIENASYGLTICAERVAIFNAISAGEQVITIAVTCLKGNPEDPNSLMPCGACRQVMIEFMDGNSEVIVDGVGVFTLDELLPRPFQLPPTK